MKDERGAFIEVANKRDQEEEEGESSDDVNANMGTKFAWVHRVGTQESE